MPSETIIDRDQYGAHSVICQYELRDGVPTITQANLGGDFMKVQLPAAKLRRFEALIAKRLAKKSATTPTP